MNDPRRIKVPWYSWRWRLGLLVPMALFVLLAANSLTDVRSHPFLSIGYLLSCLRSALGAPVMAGALPTTNGSQAADR